MVSSRKLTFLELLVLFSLQWSNSAFLRLLQLISQVLSDTLWLHRDSASSLRHSGIFGVSLQPAPAWVTSPPRRSHQSPHQPSSTASCSWCSINTFLRFKETGDGQYEDKLTCLLSIKACNPSLLAPCCPLVDVLLSIPANLKDAWKHVGWHVYITWDIYFLHKWTQPGNLTLFYNWSLKQAWVIYLQLLLLFFLITTVFRKRALIEKI